MNSACEELHRLFNRQPEFHYPFQETCLPKNGIYAMFEDGETAHQGRRIVRIGRHIGDDRLASRLLEHYVNENKDRSILRKNIGRALLAKRNDPFLSQWNLDLTSRQARAQHSIDLEKQAQVEQAVSAFLREHISFAVLELREKSERREWEQLLVGTLSHCGECKPSGAWLGLYSPKDAIRESGLWQVQGLGHAPMSGEEIRRFSLLLG